MKTTKGKLRNITTAILHTPIGDVYEFLNEFLKTEGLMTHNLPSACEAVQPFLRLRLSEEWFKEKWIKSGLDEPIEIDDLTEDELKSAWEQFNIRNKEMWKRIGDKTVLVQA